MADFLQQLRLGGTTYDFYDSEFIIDNRNSGGAALTGVSKASELFDGMQITYWLNQAAGANATLNLTLSNNETTGAIPIYYSGTTRLGTQYAAGSVLRLVYKTNVTIGETTIAAGWWADANDSDNYLPLVGGTMEGRLNIHGTPINGAFTGTGDAAYDAGDGATNRYHPAKWTFDTGFTATDGDIFIIKVPVAGHSYGVYISVDNGTHYYPTAIQGTSRLQTSFAVDVYIAITFESGASVADMFALNGADARATVSGGAFRVLNYYDSNTNTLQRTYRSTTNVELPVAGISTANSKTAAYSAISSGSYKDVYAAIPNDTAKVVSLNPSTGYLTFKALTANQAVKTDANKRLVSNNLAVSTATDESTEATRFVHSVTEDAMGKITVKTRPMPSYIPASEKGANSGVAELDANGKVPTSQLPSYVDDVLEYANLSSFPATGETGKIYIALDTDKTYRWSGTTYTEISASLALGETNSTAFRGDHGKTAYDHATDFGKLTTAQTIGLYKVSTTAEGHVGSVSAVQKSDITGLGITDIPAAPTVNGNYIINQNSGTITWTPESTEVLTIVATPESGGIFSTTILYTDFLAAISAGKIIQISIPTYSMSGILNSKTGGYYTFNVYNPDDNTVYNYVFSDDEDNDNLLQLILEDAQKSMPSGFQVALPDAGHYVLSSTGSETAWVKSTLEMTGTPLGNLTQDYITTTTSWYDYQVAISSRSRLILNISTINTIFELIPQETDGSLVNVIAHIALGNDVYISLFTFSASNNSGTVQFRYNNQIISYTEKAYNAINARYTEYFANSEGLSDGNYILNQSSGTSAWTALPTIPNTPDAPTVNGNYYLNQNGGTVTWGDLSTASVSYATSAGTATSATSASSAAALSAEIANTRLPRRLQTASMQGYTTANDAIQQGWHYISPGGSTDAVAPPFKQVDGLTGKDYRIMTTAYGDTWLQQMATDYRSNDVFFRRKQNGTWTAWTALVKMPQGATAAQLTPTTGSIAIFDSGRNATIKGSGVTIDTSNNITIAGLTASQAVGTDANKKLVSKDLSVTTATDDTTAASRFVSSVTQDAFGQISVTTKPLPTIPAVPTIGFISLTTTWSGNGPYTQTVSISGGTANSKIDLQPNSTVLTQMTTDGVTAMYVENNNGTFTVYTLGAAPSAALTIQYTRTEVTTS